MNKTQRKRRDGATLSFKRAIAILTVMVPPIMGWYFPVNALGSAEKMYESKVVREHRTLSHPVDLRKSAINLGMSTEDVRHSWGEVFRTSKLPFAYRSDEPDYQKLYGADEAWFYPKEEAWFKIQKQFSGLGFVRDGYYYLLLFKDDKLIKILEMRQQIK